MTRALGLLALAVALAVGAAAPAAGSERHPTLAELEREVVCPTCRTTLDQSSSPVADRMRRFIVRRIAAGDTKSEIKRDLVRRFGPRVVQPAPPRRASTCSRGCSRSAASSRPRPWSAPRRGAGAGGATAARPTTSRSTTSSNGGSTRNCSTSARSRPC